MCVCVLSASADLRREAGLPGVWLPQWDHHVFADRRQDQDAGKFILALRCPAGFICESESYSRTSLCAAFRGQCGVTLIMLVLSCRPWATLQTSRWCSLPFLRTSTGRVGIASCRHKERWVPFVFFNVGGNHFLFPSIRYKLFAITWFWCCTKCRYWSGKLNQSKGTDWLQCYRLNECCSNVTWIIYIYEFTYVPYWNKLFVMLHSQDHLRQVLEWLLYTQALSDVAPPNCKQSWEELLFKKLLFSQLFVFFPCVTSCWFLGWID